MLNDNLWPTRLHAHTYMHARTRTHAHFAIWLGGWHNGIFLFFPNGFRNAGSPIQSLKSKINLLFVYMRACLSQFVMQVSQEARGPQISWNESYKQL